MKNKRWILVAVACLLAALFLATGCKNSDVPKNACLVELEGNATTGYAWTAAEYDETKLSVVELEYAQQKAAAGMTGVGGVYRFYIQPAEGVTGGEFDVVFRYQQSWEGGDKNGGTATAHVTVSSAGEAILGKTVVILP